MFEILLTTEGLAALAALTAVEVILGVDNIVFIAVLVSRLPEAQAKRARRFGLFLALVMRIGLLLTMTSLLMLREPAIAPFGWPVSWTDLVLFLGGLFLVVKATHEMHLQLEGGGHLPEAGGEPRLLLTAMVQIAVIDLVFSIDSMVTAIGMARDRVVLVLSVVIAMVVMFAAAGPVSRFIHRHPTTKTLALAFLLLIGAAMVGEALGATIAKPVIFALMAFALFVEGINLLATAERRKRRRDPPAALGRVHDGSGQRDAKA